MVDGSRGSPAVVGAGPRRDGYAGGCYGTSDESSSSSNSGDSDSSGCESSDEEGGGEREEDEVQDQDERGRGGRKEDEDEEEEGGEEGEENEDEKEGDDGEIIGKSTGGCKKKPVHRALFKPVHRAQCSSSSGESTIYGRMFRVIRYCDSCVGALLQFHGT